MVEWTDADLAIIQSLDAAGTPVAEIGRRLGRRAEEVERELPIVRQREGALPVPTPPGNNADQPWLGPDEEGDVEPARDTNDTAAWVHVDPAADVMPE